MQNHFPSWHATLKKVEGLAQGRYLRAKFVKYFSGYLHCNCLTIVSVTVLYKDFILQIKINAFYIIAWKELMEGLTIHSEHGCIMLRQKISVD